MVGTVTDQACWDLNESHFAAKLDSADFEAMPLPRAQARRKLVALTASQAMIYDCVSHIAESVAEAEVVGSAMRGEALYFAHILWARGCYRKDP